MAPGDDSLQRVQQLAEGKLDANQSELLAAEISANPRLARQFALEKMKIEVAARKRALAARGNSPPSSVAASPDPDSIFDNANGSSANGEAPTPSRAPEVEMGPAPTEASEKQAGQIGARTQAETSDTNWDQRPISLAVGFICGAVLGLLAAMILSFVLRGG